MYHVSWLNIWVLWLPSQEISVQSCSWFLVVLLSATLSHVLLILGHRGAVWGRGDLSDSWEKLKLFSLKYIQMCSVKGLKADLVVSADKGGKVSWCICRCFVKTCPFLTGCFSFSWDTPPLSPSKKRWGWLFSSRRSEVMLSASVQCSRRQRFTAAAKQQSREWTHVGPVSSSWRPFICDQHLWCSIY